MKLFESRDTPVFAYYFDSLMTTIREFRTIKCCEFFKTGDIILNPSLAIDTTPQKWEGVDRRMERFIEKNQPKFNTSQMEALLRV